MLLGMTYYEIFWYFCIYSFCGWVAEVGYHAVKQGQVVNRGFLNGPVCPVYGVGMLGVLLAVNGLESRFASLNLSGSSGNSGLWDLLVLFGVGIALTTAVELVAGRVLDALFHTRWWDYRDQPLNFRGYICLRFSLIWGLAVVFVVKLVHPIFRTGLVAMIPETYGWWILLALGLIYLVDGIITVLTIVGLNKKLEKLDEMREDLRLVSDRLTTRIAARSISAARTIQEGKVQAALGREEWKQSALDKRQEVAEDLDLRRERVREKLDEMYRELGRTFVARRLLKAFPAMKHHHHDEVLTELRQIIEELKTKGKQ